MGPLLLGLLAFLRLPAISVYIDTELRNNTHPAVTSSQQFTVRTFAYLRPVAERGAVSQTAVVECAFRRCAFLVGCGVDTDSQKYSEKEKTSKHVG